MMSERKRKQKFTPNPRGKYWSENSNKFGQKLLEKMGWSAGKGLGAKEDGMTEHIRVAFKNDTQGVGFKETDDQWTEHQANFTELLNTLSGSSKGEEIQNESKIVSLEQKSQASKARVHYHKFTRGKDLSRYSEKDLANIFGKKNLKDIAKPMVENEEKEDEKENSETKSFGVVTHNGGNILDYFKNKLPNFKNHSTANSDNKNNDSESDVERPSFGLGFSTSSTQDEEKSKSESEVNKKKYKKSKGDNTDNFRKQCFGLGYDRYNGHEDKPKSEFTSFVKATDTSEQKAPLEYGITFSKKKDKANTEDNNNSSEEKRTNGFGFNSSNISKIQSSFMSFIKGGDQKNNLDNSESVNKAEKKKHKKMNDSNEVDHESTINSEEGKKKKTKKNKIVESEISPVNGEVPTEEGFKVKKKKKIVEPTFVSFVKENGSLENKEDESEKKKNKKDKRENRINLDETIDNDKITELCTDIENSENSKKKKKSKKDKSKMEENEDETIEEIVPSKKGKKRKSESELETAFTPMKKKFKNFEDLHTLHDEEKIVETPTKKIKKKKGDKSIDNCDKTENSQNGLANPAFDPLYSEVKIQKHHLDAIVEEPENVAESPVDKNTGTETNLQTMEEKGKSDKKKKKKSKSIVGIDNPCVEEISKIDETTQINSLDELDKKKKKKSKSIVGIDNPSVEEISKMDESSQTVDDSAVSEMGKKKKSKKFKKEKETSTVGIENSAFDENFKADDNVRENGESYEIKGKKRKREDNEAIVEDISNGEKKKKKKKLGSKEIVPENNSSVEETSQADQIVDETPSKSKKKKKKHLIPVENPCFNSDDSFLSLEVTPNKYEVKRTKKDKNLGITNPALDLTSPPPTGSDKNETVTDDMPVMDENIMLNVVSTPIIKKDNDKKPQRRKSVRFSDVNQSIFINKLDSPADLKKNGHGGLDNAAYDQFGNRIEENIDTLNKQLDDYQAEVENDLNEAKMQIMIGEVGDPNGENEVLPTGEVKLKFKYANFGRMPPWMTKSKAMTNPKSSYRHLIKGDIILGFKNANMHDIKGYNMHLQECSA